METSKLQDHPSRSPLADKIIRSKTQTSPPNHPITSHQFQSLGTCQESETQLAHYMSFSSGCPPRALIFVRTPECHDTPEIYICHNNLTEKLEQSSGYPMLSDFKNSHPRTWPNSSHLVHFSSHTSTPRVANLVPARSAETRVPLMKSAAPRFSSFHGTWKVSRSNHCGIPEYTSFITEGVSPQKNLIYRFLLHWVPPITKLKSLKSWPHISTMHINDNC